MMCDVWVAVCQPFVKRIYMYDDDDDTKWHIKIQTCSGITNPPHVHLAMNNITLIQPTGSKMEPETG